MCLLLFTWLLFLWRNGLTVRVTCESSPCTYSLCRYVLPRPQRVSASCSGSFLLQTSWYILFHSPLLKDALYTCYWDFGFVFNFVTPLSNRQWKKGNQRYTAIEGLPPGLCSIEESNSNIFLLRRDASNRVKQTYAHILRAGRLQN